MQLSLLDIYNQMQGFAKGIVYVLALMSIWSLSIAIKKWWDLRQAQGETRKFAPEFSQFLEEDNLVEAVTLADKYKKSHVARVLGGALTEIRPLIQDVEQCAKLTQPMFNRVRHLYAASLSL